MFKKIFRKKLNKFSKHIITVAFEKGKINSEQYHYLAGLIDKDLFGY